jgi:uncharacterized membrane protein YkgB
MRFVPLLSIMLVSAAQAHPALLPHDHAQGGGMLPDLGTFVLTGILLFAGGLAVFARRRGD